MHGIADGPMASSEQFLDLSDRLIPVVHSPWTVKWVKSTEVTCISEVFKTQHQKCCIQKQLLLPVAVPTQPLQWFLKQTTYNSDISIHALVQLLQWNTTMQRTKRSPSLLRDEGQITCRVTRGAIFKKVWGRLLHTLLIKTAKGGMYFVCENGQEKVGLTFSGWLFEISCL